MVGDERQLPPTKFFSKMTSAEPDEDGDDDTQVSDIESILGLFTARGLPQRMLRWHYRSRHQSLIAVSNSQFYENKLFIVPSPYTQEAGMGLQFHHIANGVFDSGNTGTNAEEAKVIAAAIIDHARNAPQHSLGVATFSVKQRRAIQDELELLRRQHPDVEPFFQQHASEPFFIKNLENVQGDERDVIFISVGYGRNKLGTMAMRFGPLSAEGGERRLNVLISRAKRRCEVFASITDEDIDLERAKGRGVAAFKLFLHFARTGKLGLSRVSGREDDSPFEVQVADAVKACGYEVHPQVGIAGFFIDLGIADAEHPGRYLLGIECDGESYHRSRSARDRDRLAPGRAGRPWLDHPPHLEPGLVSTAQQRIAAPASRHRCGQGGAGGARRTPWPPGTQAGCVGGHRGTGRPCGNRPGTAITASGRRRMSRRFPPSRLMPMNCTTCRWRP